MGFIIELETALKILKQTLSLVPASVRLTPGDSVMIYEETPSTDVWKESTQGVLALGTALPEHPAQCSCPAFSVSVAMKITCVYPRFYFRW